MRAHTSPLRGRWLLVAMAGTAAVSATAGCAQQTSPGAAQSGEISLSVGAPLSGANARAGQETLHAVQIAVDEFNAAGGLGGRKVRVIQGDDQGDPQAGQSVAQKFCDDESVVAVIGHYNSGVTIPASDVYKRCGLALISPLSSNPDVTDRGLPNVFRVGARDDYMGPAIATYLATKTSHKKISTIDDQSSYGVGLVDEFTATAEKSGLTIVKSAAIKAGDKDFRAVLGTIPKDTEVIYFGGYPADAALLAQQAREVGLDVLICGGDGLYDPDFLKGGQAVEGSFLTASAGNVNASARKFLDAYGAKYGKPSGYGLLEYNAARLVLQAITRAERVDRASIVTSLRGITYTPVQGGDPIVFDAKGDNKNAEVHIFTVKNADFSEVAVLKPADFR
ncbi:branched-chain amino acid ABC transporter substrate-binding protein [Nonomuraea lactucae]|uniref:branched-chain amino acid ABC transporter substrate-binding protein n=1 Tax=Nonomuraea lactucae TaxID=2249762 RepID=UPI000DE4C627|nr:branched-chain amino acid ABC transporter substrate-binding protein [Nonomuraea lactucae]